MDIKIELAWPEDWEKIKNLRLQALSGPDVEMFTTTPEETLVRFQAMTREDWQEEINGANRFIVTAKEGEKIIGMGGAVKLNKRGLWRLRWDYVHPEYRGKSIHPNIISFRIQEIRQRGGKKLIAGIKDTNSRSRNGYEKNGFIEDNSHRYKKDRKLGWVQFTKEIG